MSFILFICWKCLVAAQHRRDFRLIAVSPPRVFFFFNFWAICYMNRPICPTIYIRSTIRDRMDVCGFCFESGECDWLWRNKYFTYFLIRTYNAKITQHTAASAINTLPPAILPAFCSQRVTFLPWCSDVRHGPNPVISK